MTILLPGMPATYGMPTAMPPMMGGVSPWGGMMGMPAPVYISSMSQLPPGAVPVSQQMIAQALGQSGLAGQLVQPEQPSMVGRVLKGAGIGAAAGAAFGVIPFLPLGLFSGALVGAGVGAAIALVKGLVGTTQENEFKVMSPAEQQAAAMAQMAASTPPGARSAAMTSPAAPAAPHAPVRRRPARRPRPAHAAHAATHTPRPAAHAKH